MNSSVFAAAFHQTSRVAFVIRRGTRSFALLAKSAATYCAAAKRQRRLCLCSERVEVWVVMQIANCAGHRGKSEGNGSLPARRAEGGTNWCEPPSLLSLSLSLSSFLLFTLSTLNWQLAGKWMRCEVSPLKCRVLLFRQQRSSMRDICCSVIRIHLVTCLPSPRSLPIPLPPLPRNIHSVNWGRASFSPSPPPPHSSSTTFFSRMLLKCLLRWHPTHHPHEHSLICHHNPFPPPLPLLAAFI